MMCRFTRYEEEVSSPDATGCEEVAPAPMVSCLSLQRLTVLNLHEPFLCGDVFIKKKQVYICRNSSSYPTAASHGYSSLNIMQ